MWKLENYKRMARIGAFRWGTRGERMRDTFRNSAHLTPNNVEIVWQAQSAVTFPLEAKSHHCLRSGQIYDIKSTLGPLRANFRCRTELLYPQE